MSKLDEAHDMAKRMQRKLLNYNKDEIYSSVAPPDFKKQLRHLTDSDLADLIKALVTAQWYTHEGEIKERWDTLIEYFKKHLAAPDA